MLHLLLQNRTICNHPWPPISFGVNSLCLWFRQTALTCITLKSKLHVHCILTKFQRTVRLLTFGLYSSLYTVKLRSLVHQNSRKNNLLDEICVPVDMMSNFKGEKTLRNHSWILYDSFCPLYVFLMWIQGISSETRRCSFFLLRLSLPS